MSKPAASVSSGPSFAVEDIYYTLFRHKWKIVILTLIGVAAGAWYYMQAPQLYASTASLLIRYVQEGKGPTSPGGSDQFRSPDARGGASIINAEVEIINSLDVALAVADSVGPEKILARVGGGNDRAVAAAVVQRGLSITRPKQSSVINLTYTHQDQTVVQPVLAAVIEAYFKRHIEIHRPAGSYDDFLTQQTDQMRARLATTEDELRKARAKAGIISLDDTRKAQSETINALKRQLLDVQRHLAQRQATLAQALQAIKGATPVAKPDANAQATAPVMPPQAVIESYQAVLNRLATLKRREQEMLMQFTPENPRVRELRERIVVDEELKAKIEKDNPVLLVNAPVATGERGPSTEAQSNLSQMYLQIAGLESDVKVLFEQLAQVRQEAADLDTLETNIQELERRRSVEESNYKTFAANLERIRMEEALGSGLVTNISKVETPTPPFRSMTRDQQIAAGIGASGLVLSLILAFGIEFFLDRSVRRTTQIERTLGLDVFVSIPVIEDADQGPISGQQIALRGDSAPPWEPANALHAYYSALRDRTISFFDSNEINHKPRLVALSGLGKDHGAKEIAAGLAGCLSETGEGKVLFVDMTSNQGDAQQFFRGHDVSSIDEALTESPDAKGRVNENLYVARTEGQQGDNNLPLILPKRFSHLVPKLRSSDFDYIIFNLPPVSNLSVTPRLAQHMDVVMLVMESEKTDLSAAEKAKSMLSNSKAHVAAILNKTHQYVPRLLSKELS